MNFDADGRLWVCTRTAISPPKLGQPAEDKILVLEDQDGDGRADRSSVFAAGLAMPTGLEPGGGGVYVVTDTELVLLKDTDDDGKADFRQVVLSGFGRSGPLTSASASALESRRGASVHSARPPRSHVETPYGVRRLAGGGIWQLRPTTLQLDVLAGDPSVSAGIAWDRWGQAFVAGGLMSNGLAYLFPGMVADLSNEPGQFEKRADPSPPALSALEILGGRHLPDDWQDSLIACDPQRATSLQVHSDRRRGRFLGAQTGDVLTSTDKDFLPIDVKQGPDGAIYVADWHAPVAAVPGKSGNDPPHGRIWRISAKGRPLTEPHKLSEASIAALLNQLKSPEAITRNSARRLLADARRRRRGPRVGRLGDRLTAKPYRLRALPARSALDVSGLDLVEPKLLERCLRRTIRGPAQPPCACWACGMPGWLIPWSCWPRLSRTKIARAA